MVLGCPGIPNYKIYVLIYKNDNYFQETYTVKIRKTYKKMQVYT